MSNSESKFNRYLKNAKTAYKKGRYRNVLWNLQKALGKSRKLKDSKGEAEVLKKFGWIYAYKLYNYDVALEHYEKSLVISRELEDIKMEGNILNSIGTVYYKLSNCDKSLEYYGKSLKTSRNSEYPEWGHLLESVILVNIGFVYISLCNHDKALWHFEKSLKISREPYSRRTKYKNFRSAEWKAFCGFGICYFALGKHDKALDYLRRSLNICTELKDSLGEALCQGFIGFDYTSLGYYDKALECFDKSLKIISRVSTGLYFIIAKWQTFYGFGRCYVALGKHDKALDYLRRSLNISKTLKDPSGEVLCQNSIGLVYLSIGKYKKAMECFKIVLRMDLKGQGLLGQALLMVGIVYSIHHEPDKAIEYLNKSIKIFKESQMRENEGWAHGIMGNIYTDLGKYDKAIEVYENGLAIGIECKYPEMIYTISTNYAEKYEDYFNGESENLNKAFGLYEEAINASLFIKDNVKELAAREFFLVQHVDAFEGYIRTGHVLAEQSDDLAVKRDYYRKIFEAAEKSKARTVVDLLANIKIKYEDKASEKLAAELEEKKRLIQQSCKKSDEYGFGTHLGIIRHSTPVYTPQLRASALEDCRKVEEAFEKNAFADCALRNPIMKSFNEILGALKDDHDTVVLEYCEVGNNEYILYVLNYTGFLINPVRLKLPKIRESLFALEDNMDKKELCDFFKEISVEGYSFTDLKGYYRFFQNCDEGLVFPMNILAGIEQLQIHAQELGMTLPYNRFLEISQYYLDESLRKWGEVLLPDEVLNSLDEISQASSKIPHLLIVPDGFLYHIPFHSLIVRNSNDNSSAMKSANANNDKYHLIDKYDISYNVSMTAQWICRQEITPGRKEENYVYFGGAAYSEAEMLHSYKDEIGSIERRINTRHGEKIANSRFATFTGSNVTLKNFKDKSDKYTNHVVTVHGAFIPDAPMKSYFLFLDDKGDECKYTLEDMIGDEELIFRNSHLFWAGACKLGMSAVTDGKDIIGLVRTLIQKGVPSVVMGLTNLDDRATARLLDNFCQVYDGNNKAKGLSEAIRQLRKCTLCDHAKKSGDSIDELKQYFNAQSDEFVFDNPYFWMPFVLYGDFR